MTGLLEGKVKDTETAIVHYYCTDTRSWLQARDSRTSPSELRRTRGERRSIGGVSTYLCSVVTPKSASDCG